MNNYTKVNWLPKLVLYEVNIRQYTIQGTFKAFLEHLPRLQQMGITAIWLMPIQPIGVINRKGTMGSCYSISDYTAINPDFGTIKDFKLLVDEAHHYNIKVILDWVANHTALDHYWVQEQPSFYALNENNEMFSPNDWSDVIQLNHNNIAQQNAMVQAMQYWVNETNIDGFRCDMAHLVPLQTWHLARQKCEINKPLFWLAETQEENYFEVFDAIYSWEWMHAMQKYYEQKIDANQLISFFEKYNKGNAFQKQRILFTSNHDENSWQGTEYQRFGDSALSFAILSMFLPGIPLLYSGQEEPLLKQLSFFEKDEIMWNNYSLVSFYTILIQLKNKFLCGKNVNEQLFNFLQNNQNSTVFSFLRKDINTSIIVIANLKNEAQSIKILDNKIIGNYSKVFDSELVINKSIDLNSNKYLWQTQQYLQLNAWQVLIFVK